MTTDTETHNVVVTQHYAEKEFSDANGAAIHLLVTTSQVAGKAGIDRQLHFEVTQPQKINGQTEAITVRRNLSWENAVELKTAADRLAGVAETWRSTPSPSRSCIEFLTTVVDGFAIGRRTKNTKIEYFVQASEEHDTARCALGGMKELNEFVYHISEAANLLR